jgi:hypothetical protein
MISKHTPAGPSLALLPDLSTVTGALRQELEEEEEREGGERENTTALFSLLTARVEGEERAEEEEEGEPHQYAI